MTARWSITRAAVAVIGLMTVASQSHALVPDKDATKDSQGQPIGAAAGDIYTLPAGATIFHGTVSPWAFGKTVFSKPTWFGADLETSEAMGYFRWCRNSGGKGIKAPPADPAKSNFEKGAYDLTQWPQMMTVKVLHDQHLLLIPFGTDGHPKMFRKIGFNQPSNLYGSGSNAGLDAFVGSGLCGTTVYYDENGAAKTIVAYKKASGQPEWLEGQQAKHNGKLPDKSMTLDGWRAPWDQNEIAVCAAKSTSDNFQAVPNPNSRLASVEYSSVKEAYDKNGLAAILKGATTGPDMAKKLSEASQGKKDKAAADAYLTALAAAADKMCGLKSDRYAVSAGSAKTGYFDIVFKNKAKPEVQATLNDDSSTVGVSAQGVGDMPSDPMK